MKTEKEVNRELKRFETALKKYNKTKQFNAVTTTMLVTIITSLKWVLVSSEGKENNG